MFNLPTIHTEAHATMDTAFHSVALAETREPAPASQGWLEHVATALWHVGDSSGCAGRGDQWPGAF